MRFDVRLHKETPEGFRQESYADGSNNTINPNICTRYVPDSSLHMYGLNGTVSAVLITSYAEQRRMLGRKRITGQSAKLHLGFDPTYEGYERSEEHRGNVTMGRSADGEKIAVAKKLVTALEREFKKQEYDCSVELRGIPTITIMPKDGQNPIQAFTEIFSKLEGIAAAYDRSEKPLGDIQEASGKVKINPHLNPQPFPPAREPSGEEPDRWQNYTQQRMVDAITALAKQHFPIGIEENQHAQFKTALQDFLTKGR